MSALLALVALLWGCGWLLLWRFRPCDAAPVGGGDGAGRGAGDGGGVSVIIPARDEERNLPALLGSLRVQVPGPGEVIVVDDGSADRTAEVARAGGARVLVSGSLPEGWRGKTWACWQGAREARGDLLLFLDADVWFEGPDGLARLLATRRAGALSVGPYHRMRAWYEELSAFFVLVMAAGTGAFAAFGGRRGVSGMFGQSLLVDRASYGRAGGHEAVRGRTLENLWMGERCRGAGVPVECCGGRGVLSVRMYPDGIGGLIEGWGKGFASGASRTPRGLMLLTVAWLIGLTLPVVGLGIAPSWGWALAYAFCAVQVGALLRAMGAFRFWTAALYPVPLAFFFGLFAVASRRRSAGGATWKGRRLDGD